MSTEKSPALQWVNHASFVLDYDGIRLISDPWLEGPAFFGRWSLLSETKFRYEDFASITHLWISHQHPDHFSPPNLRNIPPEVRAKITVLYQATKDRLVVNFLQGLKFKEVIELDPARWYQLSPSMSVLCRPLGDDSWMAIRTAHGTVLNINDCIVDAEAVAHDIHHYVGGVKLLLSQFAYANWVANPEDRARRRREAREKLERLRLQSAVFDPEYVVPFASFVWFCHEDNFYLNRDLTRVETAATFIERDLRRKPIVLYPGEVWSLGQPHDWRPAARRYGEDMDRRLAHGPIAKAQPTDLAHVVEEGQRFFRRLRSRTSWLVRFPAIKTSVYLPDHDVTLELSVNGMRQIDNMSTADISTHSENLLYCFRAPWGANALNANGCFTESASGSHRRFFLFFRIAELYGRARLDAKWLSSRLLTHGTRFLTRKMAHYRRRRAVLSR